MFNWNTMTNEIFKLWCDFFYVMRFCICWFIISCLCSHCMSNVDFAIKHFTECVIKRYCNISESSYINRTTSIIALFTLLNEYFSCFNRCKETEDHVQSSRITAHPDSSSPTPNKSSRGSPQEPTAMDSTLMLESRVARVSNSCGLSSIYTRPQIFIICTDIWVYIEVIPIDWTFSPADDAFTIDLQNFRKPGEKTYTQRSRLFVGNLPTGTTEEDVEKLFSKYGKPSEIFINKDRGFGFIRLVSLTRHHFGKKSRESEVWAVWRYNSWQSVFC